MQVLHPKGKLCGLALFHVARVISLKNAVGLLRFRLSSFVDIRPRVYLCAYIIGKDLEEGENARVSRN